MKKPKLIKTELDEPILELVNKSDHKILGIWAAECAKKVLPYFEKKYPKDDRPRKAIKTLLKWVRTGEFKMAVIRKVSLSAHAAARAVEKDDAGRSAARACGQAVATAHIKAHSAAAAIYAATAILYATESMDKANKEREWQYRRLIYLTKK